MAARRRKSPRGTRITGSARSGQPRAKPPSDSEPPVVKRSGTDRTKHKLLDRLGQPTPRGGKLRDAVARTAGSVSGAFWSQANGAWRVEFSIRRGNTWYTSSFYCEHQEDADRLAALAHSGWMTVEQWADLYGAAMQIAKASNGYLWRVMLNGRLEVFREQPKPVWVV